MMSRLFLWLAAAVLSAVIAEPGEAAKITHESLGERRGVIAIEGEITSSDLVTFRRLTLAYDTALVALDSDGGKLIPAIEIGKIIQIAGYTTVVPDDAMCASSCALIWLAGSKRLLAPSGNVGFHASYRDVEGRQEESGLANALVGNYLTLLNLPRRAIIFATSAAPDEISWLTQDNKAQAGIDFEPFVVESDGQDQAASDTSSRAVRPPPIQVRQKPPSPSLPSHLPVSLSSTGENWLQFASDGYYDANSIQRVRNYSGNDSGRALWILVDNKSNGKAGNAAYSLVKMHLNCAEQTQSYSEWIEFQTDGRRKSKEVIRSPFAITPGSPGKNLMLRVCK